MARMVCLNNPTHDRFITTAHEVHDWLVDGEGTFIDDLGCIDTAHFPDTGNIWTCESCGKEAVRAD